MIDIDTHISNLETVIILITDVLEEARDLRATMHVSNSGIVANGASMAHVHHEYERHDLLPIGRLHHSPTLGRMDLNERRDWALRTMATLEWFTPLEWSTQHHKQSDAARTWKGRMQAECTLLHRAGLLERRMAGRRGVRYEYRLLDIARPNLTTPGA